MFFYFFYDFDVLISYMFFFLNTFKILYHSVKYTKVWLWQKLVCFILKIVDKDGNTFHSVLFAVSVQ